jgi:hypothetical protein
MIRRVIRDAIVAAAVGAAVTHVLRWLGRKVNKEHSEKLLDEALVETFPASDPPATQDFDIPANRQ